MKLAVVTHVYPANPHAPSDIAGNFLPPFVHELARLGVKLHVLAPQVPERDIPDPAVPVTRFQWWVNRRPLGQFQVYNPIDATRLTSLILYGVRELKVLIEREHIDAILACWAVPSGLIASFANKPYAVWGLGTDIHTAARHRLTRPFVQRALRRASIRYANSVTLIRQIEELSGLGCELLANMRPLPTNVNHADFPKDRFNFFTAARLEHVKGIDVLLEALGRIPAPRPRVYIAGTGTLEKELRAQAAHLNLQNDVIFMGLLDEHSMASALSACDALVISSRDESIPMVFKEAAGFGAPVVATNVGDLQAFVAKYDSGIIVPPNDAAALAQAMMALMHAPREKYRAHLRELAELFDLTRSATKLLGDLKALSAKMQEARNTN